MNISIIEPFDGVNNVRHSNYFPDCTVNSIDLTEYFSAEYNLSLGNDHYDSAADQLVDKNKLTLEQSQVIVINHIGDQMDNFSGLRTAHHIRLDSSLRQIPIVLIGPEILCSILTSVPDLSQILLTKGIGYFLSEKSFMPNVAQFKKDLSLSFRTAEAYKENFLDRIVIKTPEEQQGRHGIANQWGAYRMAQVAGLDMKYFTYPKTLYFKYLLAQSGTPESKELRFPVVRKVLFVDDNHDKGWITCLKAFFGDDNIESYESWEKAEINGAKEKIINDEFDLIFLDLYIGDNDRIGAGKKLLQKIKGYESEEPDNRKIEGLNPVIPVIMFTASNKAWNMDELYEAGADGYYVKEHPETAHDPEFSVNNFENFHKTVKNCLEKGELLRKYWRKIRDIEKSEAIKNKTVANGHVQMNRERIHERLIMFLGLLKKAFEQTQFDKSTFFYSDWELAFLTLWSTLNEIQEVYYEKTQPTLSLQDSSGVIYSKHLGRNRHQAITYLKTAHKNNFKWTLNREVFIEYAYKLDEDPITKRPIVKNEKYVIRGTQKSTLLFNKWNQTYSPTEIVKTEVDFERTLHVQIAFLLIKMNSKNTLLTYLANLNSKVRNKLYLTHGDDSSSPNFHEEYKNQRKDYNEWKKHLEHLFEIVYFLCTGKDCDWST